jgi:hypothetical protein
MQPTYLPLFSVFLLRLFQNGKLQDRTHENRMSTVFVQFSSVIESLWSKRLNTSGTMLCLLALVWSALVVGVTHRGAAEQVPFHVRCGRARSRGARGDGGSRRARLLLRPSGEGASCIVSLSFLWMMMSRDCPGKWSPPFMSNYTHPTRARARSSCGSSDVLNAWVVVVFCVTHAGRAVS